MSISLTFLESALDKSFEKLFSKKTENDPQSFQSIPSNAA